MTIDLERKTIDLRYIQKDIGTGFITTSDDFGMLKCSIKKEEDLSELHLSQLEEIKTYNSIFEAAYNFLFLPEYFDFFNDICLPEEHPTGLNQIKSRKPIFKNHQKLDLNYFEKYKDVWVLDRHIDAKSGSIKIKKTELKIEKDGYWQRLNPGKIGIDKNGNQIHSRTWVEKTLSWHESNDLEPNVEISFPKFLSQNKGYIYMLRNAAHDIEIFKIGLTTKTVENRAKQLSGTASPDQFLIINKWAVKNCVLAEKLIHEKLDRYRLNTKREFFKLKIELAMNEILPIIEKINEE